METVLISCNKTDWESIRRDAINCSLNPIVCPVTWLFASNDTWASKQHEITTISKREVAIATTLRQAKAVSPGYSPSPFVIYKVTVMIICYYDYMLLFSQPDSFQAGISSKYALIFAAQFGLDTSVGWNCCSSPAGDTRTDLDFLPTLALANWPFAFLQIITQSSFSQRPCCQQTH